MDNKAHLEDEPGQKSDSNSNGKRVFEEIDWSLIQNEDESSNGNFISKEWFMFTRNEKAMYTLFTILKLFMFAVLLFLFLLSLKFMTIGFTMVSSYTLKAGDAIKFILANPFAGLAIGIIATAIMQNATATTSIAVSMVGAGIIPSVKSAIPIIMGSNIGTCVTNSFIALTLSSNPNEFKRAFSAATLNDVFNFLTVLVLLPLEIFTNFLFKLSNEITNLIPFENAEKMSKADFLSCILNPVVDIFIKLNSTAVDELSKGNKHITEVALRCCEITNQQNLNLLNGSIQFDKSSITFNFSRITNSSNCIECSYWCMPMLKAFGDGGTGLFWIILSLIVLIACLFGIVKVLSLLIVGPIAKGVNKAVNASFPGKFKWLTQVVLFLISLLLTLVVQSSNIVTATLVPLCGIGIVTLQRVYVMTLGSNIGTTVTGILSAFTQPPSSLKKAMQLAFVYTLFNTFGVIFWLPIPFLRFPKIYARKLGNIVFQYRWFLYVYVSMVYFILPLILLGLALVPMWIGLAIFGIPILILLFTLILVRCINIVLKCQSQVINIPINWLPIWTRLLKPFDEIFQQTRFNFKYFFKLSKFSKRCNYSEIIDENKMQVDQSQSRNDLLSVIRKLNAINSLINEAKANKKFDTLFIIESSGDEDDVDNIAHIEHAERRNSCIF